MDVTSFSSGGIGKLEVRLEESRGVDNGYSQPQEAL